MNKLVKLAYEICTAAHAEPVDKVGMSYHLHPECVAVRCTYDAERIVALHTTQSRTLEYRKEYDRESLIGTKYEYLLHENDEPID